MSDELYHYGTQYHSGRYPYGSGDNPNQRGTSLIESIKKLERDGFNDVQIAEGMGISTTELRKVRSLDKSLNSMSKRNQALDLHDKGMSGSAIAEQMGLSSESSVRSLLDPVLTARAKIVFDVADSLRNAVDKKEYIDVGKGMEVHLGVSKTKMDNAVFLLEKNGYEVQYHNTEQNSGKKTSMKILAKSGPDDKESRTARWLAGEKAVKEDRVRMVDDHYTDYGRTKLGIEPPVSISRDRILVRYKEDGGGNQDGMIQLRRNVPDLSLGEKHYAQVRIAVDGTHFMKGMAIYTNNIPDGKDVIYNSNKPRGSDKVFKKMEADPDNPFGSSIIQRKYIDPVDGKEKLSAINRIGSGEKVNEEGAWSNWKKSISSQILSKQQPEVAKKQLKQAADIKKDEFDDINSITNPTIKKKLMLDFADGCDSAAVELAAAAMPRQSSKVLLAFDSIKEKEIYAPSYKDGEVVVLIRHPHGGIFEIPTLTVNNRNKEAIDVLGKTSVDAVVINPKVAKKLSGADFDGDAVIVIPNKDGLIKTSGSKESAAIKSLREFDPGEKYSLPEDAPKMTDKTKELQMGIVSNLITDMTIKGASEDKIARAVKHSMVVIDAVKHHYDYKQSEIDHNIAALKKEFQSSPDNSKAGGAATIVSRAGSEKRVPQRKEQYKIDPTTGKKVYEYYTNEFYINKQGQKRRVTVNSAEEAKALGGRSFLVTVDDKKGNKIKDPITGKFTYFDKKQVPVYMTTKSTKMAEVDDAFELASDLRMDKIYAAHANELKSLANQARLIHLETPEIKYSKSAHQTYLKEVEHLDAQLRVAGYNKPLERRALLASNQNISTKKRANPDMTPAVLKKMKGQSIIEMRNRTGAGKKEIILSDREWEAIQAGAVSSSKLKDIMLNMKADKLKARAMPRENVLMTSARTARAKSMMNAGATTSEIAEALGVSESTLMRSLK